MGPDAYMQEPLPPGLYDGIVTALDRAWKECIRLHDPSVGHDGMSLGMQLYRVGHFWIERIVEEIAGLHAERRHGAVVLRTGSHEIRTYQRGRSATHPIELEVLADQTAALRRLAEANDVAHELLLFDPESYGDEEPLVDGPVVHGLAIVHAGRFPDGLQAVWIGEPSTPETGKAWHWVTRIWASETANSEPLFPVVDIPILPPEVEDGMEPPIELEYRDNEERDGEVGMEGDA